MKHGYKTKKLNRRKQRKQRRMAIFCLLCYLLLVRPYFVNPCSDHNQPTGRRPTRWRSCENFVAARKFAQVAVQRRALSRRFSASSAVCHLRNEPRIERRRDNGKREIRSREVKGGNHERHETHENGRTE